MDLIPADLAPFVPDIPEDKAEAMIADALAMAELVAPCITTDEFAHAGAAKAILRAAILRWHDSGSGAVSQQVAGPFQQTLDTRTTRKSLFWPSEIDQLQNLCKESSVARAYEVDLAPEGAGSEFDLPWCPNEAL